jgi:hypothetical protein
MACSVSVTVPIWLSLISAALPCAVLIRIVLRAAAR